MHLFNKLVRVVGVINLYFINGMRLGGLVRAHRDCPVRRLKNFLAEVAVYDFYHNESR